MQRLISKVVLAAFAVGVGSCGGNSRDPNGTGTISGTVTVDGVGVPNVSVNLAANAQAPRVETTDGAGHYEFKSLSGGEYTVTAAAPGMTFETNPAQVPLSGGIGKTVNFTVSSVTVSGSVMANGTPMPGVSVELAGDAAPVTATTDPQGGFSFPSVVPGAYTVTPSMTGVVFTPTSARMDATTASATVAFTTGGLIISGTVTAGNAGAPGVKVELTPQGASQASASTATDSGGGFVFANVAPGTYTVTPSSDGMTFNPATKQVDVGGASVSVSFQVLSVTVSGRVTGGDSGIPGIAIGLTPDGMTSPSDSVITDSAGNFDFSTVVPGIYTLTPSGESGTTFNPSSAKISVAGVRVSVLFAIAGATVSGTVKANGAGIAGITMTLSKNGTTVGTAPTNSSGAYALTSVPPDSYTITPSSPGISFNPSSAPVTITGPWMTADFAVTALALLGHVFGGTTGVQGINLTITAAGASSPAASTSTDASGAYSFSNLPLDTYTVAPAATGIALTPSTKVVVLNTFNGTADFVITGVSISGQLLLCNIGSGDYAPAAGIAVSLTADGATSPLASAVTDSNGIYTFSNVAPGTYSLMPEKHMSWYGWSEVPQTVTVTYSNVTAATIRGMRLPHS